MVAQVVELIDVQEQSGEQALNVFHYVDPTGTLDVADLLNDYVSGPLATVVGIQDSQIIHTLIRYRFVYPTATLMLEHAITPTPGVATSSGIFSPESAFSFKFILGSGTVNLVGGSLPHIKRGGCRLGGVPKGSIVNNVVSSGTVTVAAGWSTDLIAPESDGWQLCVASFLNAARVRQHTVQQYALVTGMSAPGASTQNTRKVLRGRSF